MYMFHCVSVSLYQVARGKAGASIDLENQESGRRPTTEEESR